MLALELKAFLGFVLFLFGILALFLNISVAAPVFRLAIAKDKSSIYVISSVNISNDILQLLVATFYLAPSIIRDSFWFSEERNGRFSVLISCAFMVLWYIGSVTQIVMAVNRWCVICLHRGSFFTKRNIVIVFFVTFPFAVAKSYIIQYVFPCCTLIIDHTVLSFSYFQIGDLPNYSDESDIPLNALSSIIPAVCYVHIYYTIHTASHAIGPSLQKSVQKGRRELSYAMQFCLISVFYSFTWITFRVFPLIFDGRQIEWFILTSFCLVFNDAANAFVYVMFNKEVQKQLPASKFFKFSGTSNNDIGNCLT